MPARPAAARQRPDQCPLWPTLRTQVGHFARSEKCPRGDLSRCSNSLLDDLVRACEQRWRQRNAEDLGGDKIDDQLDFHRLLYRQVGWLVALEDAANIDATQAIGIDIAQI